MGLPGPAFSRPASSETDWRLRLPFFYGWVIVASVFISLGLCYGVLYSFSVFFVALLEEFNWGRGEAAGVFSTQILMVGLVGVVVGRLIDRFGSSRIVPVGAIILAAGLFASSRISTLWQFYLFFGLIGGIGFSIASWVPAVTIINNWFSAKRGLAMGIVSAGSGLGTVVLAPLNQYLISTFGWRTAFAIVGAAVLIIVAPQAALLQVSRPEKLGLKPDGMSGQAASSPRDQGRQRVIDERWASFPWTLATAVRTRRFWLMALMMALGSFTNQLMWAHDAAYLVDAGYDKMLAASVVGLAGLLTMPTKVMWGELSDRLGREITFAMGMAAMVSAIGLLVVIGRNHYLPLVFLFAAAFGLGYAVTPPLISSSAGDIFGGKHFGGIFGLMSVGPGIGGAFGTWFAGYSFDVTGSYLLALAAAATSSTLAAVGLWIVAPRKIRRAGR